MRSDEESMVAALKALEARAIETGCFPVAVHMTAPEELTRPPETPDA